MGNRRALKNCKIYFIGNAGVLISADGTSVMIDGLYASGGDGFHASPIPKDILYDLYCRKGRLPGPDFLIFSHQHDDHLSVKLLDSYLDTHRPGCVFLPEKSFGVPSRFIHNMKRLGTVHEIVAGEQEQYRPAKNFEVVFYKTRHLGKQFTQVLHYCILITLSGYRLLFTADVDFFSESLNQFRNIPLHAVFVNPFFYHNETGQHILGSTVKANRIFIYHLPFEEDDKYYMQHMVRTDIHKYQRSSPVVMLCTPKQEYTLNMQKGEWKM